MSTPTTTPRQTPKRTTPKRTPRQDRSPSQKNERRIPLQERTPSQKNAAAGLSKEIKSQSTEYDIFTTTPFPTKPQHVLLPSTIRKQRSKQRVENELPGFLLDSSSLNLSHPTTGAQTRQDTKRARRAPNLQLKKSVTALRDMYEAQAESSRPSTAVRSRTSSAAPSPSLRPTSSRLRSFSSSDGLAGKSAWDLLGLPKVSPDDMALLPTLSEEFIQRLDSEHSFASRMRYQPTTSSPNYRTFDATSPVMPAYEDLASSDPIEPWSEDLLIASSPNVVQIAQSSDPSSGDVDLYQAESSPNVIQLASSPDSRIEDNLPSQNLHQGRPSPNIRRLELASTLSRGDMTPPDRTETESSPNLVKLGTSSPRRSSSPARSIDSTSSRKRKRCGGESSAYAGRTPLFFATGPVRLHSTSSPPTDTVTSSDNSVRSGEQVVLPSSPPEFGSAISQSSPVFRLPATLNTNRSSLASAHTNLQSVLSSSSSPGPPPPRPIVRAPNINQFAQLALQKRSASGPSDREISIGAQLSPVPSMTGLESKSAYLADPRYAVERHGSRSSVFTEDLNDDLVTDALSVHDYIRHEDLNNSRVNIFSDDDRHEAADEVAALPRQTSSFAAVLGQARAGSFLASSANSSTTRLETFRTSVDGRLQSMRSFTHGRNESSRSYRPGSSGSHMDHVAVPTWAYRYYSGFYQNSFHYLYQSEQNLSQPPVQIPPRIAPQRSAGQNSLDNGSSYETISNRSNLTNSWSRSMRSSIKSIVPPRILSAIRPRLDVRQSHTTAGVGPLVSNPTRPKSELIPRPSASYQNGRTIRRVSAPTSAVDPRYHWNGLIDEVDTITETDHLEDYDDTVTARHSTVSAIPRPIQASTSRYINPARFLRLASPHLHQDKRCNTGSEGSQGFGAPYNMRPKWQPSPVFTDKLGPPAWFKVDVRDLHVVCFIVGFLCPLAWFIGAFAPLPQRPGVYQDVEKASIHARNSNNISHTGYEGDIVARLRLEKHLQGLEEVKWQNARWWRSMNRWMCCVGVVVLIVIIVLAVIGTKGHW